MNAKRLSWIHFFALALFLILFSSTVGIHAAPTIQTDDEASIPPPESVTIAGTLQTQLGCSGNWNTTCAETQLTYDAANDLWTAVFELEAGEYEYKAALNGSWDDNYGLNAEYYGPNIPLTVPETGPVLFFYDHKTRWVSDNVNDPIAAVIGDFQEEIGCASDNEPTCLRSLLQDPDGDDIYTYITAAIPPGEYGALVALNQSLDVTFGAEGEADGLPISFTVPEETAVIFTFDPATNSLTIETGDPALAAGMDSGADAGLPSPAAPMPDQVVIPGTIQSQLGCPGDWQPDCEDTALLFDGDDLLWTNTFTLPTGDYEYKVALNGSWDVNFGQFAEQDGANIPLSLAEETAVSFYFDHNTGWVADSVNNIVANVPGDFQEEIGCPGDWQPDCLRSWLQDPDGDGAFTFLTDAIPAGDYEAKVAVNQSWEENYGDGGAQDGPNIPFNVPEDDTVVAFVWDSGSKVMTIRVGAGAGPVGNLKEQKAYWVAADTIAWNVDTETADTFQLHYSPAGGALSLSDSGVSGGEAIPLTLDPAGLSDEILAKFPHLRSYAALKLNPDDPGKVRIALKGQVAVSAAGPDGPVDATGLQIPGVLDDLYTYDGPLGVTWDDDTPTLAVWAPTARSVKLHRFADADPDTTAQVAPMRVDPNTGVWSITGEPAWQGQYYLYEVEVFVPAEGGVVNNLVTDPYAVSLSMNSQRSQIVNLKNGDLKPAGWDEMVKPPLAAPEDIVIYELHVRDFSANDPTVRPEYQGTYLAFTEDSAGMEHLAVLAEDGLTHLHLLPTFDIATINENAAERVELDTAELASNPPDSEEQQAIISAIRDEDSFNWGYDPYHYNVPEGSYATDPNGPARIIEYRQMVQALNDVGLRVVADVVYNHTNSSGQNEKSVLDRIVPGYYHRLNANGRVERSTCCENTATEHNMMRKLMVDSVVLWATAYKIDAFRFDLMGHHMKSDMLAVRAALDSLTLEEHGVNGQSIYVYGEGWNFGEVADNARGVNATQFNMAGTGIGTFNDRLRDAVRGGSPFGGQQEQGFINGLYYDPNATEERPPEEQLAELLHFADLTRVGLAGNLKEYEFVNAEGERVPGRLILYNGAFAGYTEDPQENIVYVSKHDNETLFDTVQYKAPLDTPMSQRVRIQNLGNSIVMLSQGIPFFQAGDDMLRSKSLDRNSYNSGDWFNRLDFTYQSNNWGVGLPPAADNESMWPVMRELLGTEGLTPTYDDILSSVFHFQEMLFIRKSSPLFRLNTAAEVQARLAFHNIGPEQAPGLIVMSLTDMAEGVADIDPEYDLIVTLFNANDEDQVFVVDALSGLPLALHPAQIVSQDPVVQTAAFDPAAAAFTVPGRTTAVFVLAEQGDEAAPDADTEDTRDDDSVDVELETEPTPETAVTPPATESVPEETTSPWPAIGIGAVLVALAGGIAIWINRRHRQG